MADRYRSPRTHSRSARQAGDAPASSSGDWPRTADGSRLHAESDAASPALFGMEWWGRWARVAGLVLAGLWAIHFLTVPFSWDQAIFAWVGGTIVDGGLPYRDAWDIKGPLAYYVVAAAEFVFGRHEWPVRAVDLVLLAVGAAVVAALARRFRPERGAAWWGALLYVLWFASLGYADTSQPDGWAGVLLAVAALLLARKSDARRRPRAVAAALAGACIGACALIKPTYGLFLLMPFVHGVEASRRDGGWRAVLEATVAAGVGFVVPLGLCVAWFAHLGGLGALHEVYILYPLRGYADLDTGWLWRVQAVTAWVLTHRFAVPLAFAVVGWRSLMTRDRPAAVLLATWCGAAFLNVIVQGQFYPYHWLPLYPPLAVLTAVGIGALVRTVSPARGGLPPRVARELVAVSAGVVALAAAFAPATTVYRWAKMLVSAQTRDAYETDEYGKNGRQRASMYSIAQYVRAHSRAGDVVLFWGRNPGYNYLIDRPLPGRFGFTPPALDRPANPFARPYRREIVAAVMANRPVYVVAMTPESCEGVTPPPTPCFTDWPEIGALVEREYHVERTMTVVDDSAAFRYDVMRRNR